jgi:gamma-glutamylputrescine oxidase
MQPRATDLPDTHYARTQLAPRRDPALSGAQVADVAVIGGGLAGLSTALHLARGGLGVAVVEARALGFGASGRNGGFVSAGFAAPEGSIARRAGAQGAAALADLAREGVDLVRETIRAQAMAEVMVGQGLLRVRRHARDDDLRASVDAQTDYLDARGLGAHVTSDRYKHALLDRNGFHIHPLNYVNALAQACAGSGVRLFARSPVTALGQTAQGWVVSTADGQITARHVVVATGGYTGALVPALRRAMQPIATFVLASRPQPDLLAQAIHTQAGIGDDRKASDYYRLIENRSRLTWGGRISTRTPDLAGIERQLRAQISATYPQLARLETDTIWSGLMSYAPHQMPHVGRLQAGLWYATAFGGHGLNTTAVAGKVLAEAILGQSDRIAAFAPFGLDWAGGLVGRAMVQATYWGLQAQDWWRER